MKKAHDKNGKLIYIDKTVEKIDISAYRDKFKQLKEQKDEPANKGRRQATEQPS